MPRFRGFFKQQAINQAPSLEPGDPRLRHPIRLAVERDRLVFRHRDAGGVLRDVGRAHLACTSAHARLDACTSAHARLKADFYTCLCFRIMNHRYRLNFFFMS